MKLITLNLWGGIVYQPLIEFIKKYSKDIDIFSFQEMLFGDSPDFTLVHKARQNLFLEISKVLHDFVPYKSISPSVHFQSEEVDFGIGQVIFVRKNILVKNSGEFSCYKKIPENTILGGKATGNLQWIDLEVNNTIITIANLHGLWQKDAKKMDTPERLIQSRIVKDFLDNKEGKKILCGDFNLSIDGESLKILDDGMVNLIKKYNAKSTRSSFFKYKNKFADYILISPDIKVEKFEILQDEVSDHLPVFLEFN